MKKIVVFGASGGTGREVVTQALQLGYEVTAFVRDPKRLGTIDARLRVITGNVTDSSAVSAAVRGQHAVISALGVGNSLKSNGLIALSVPIIVSAMKNHSVGRLVFTSAYGVGATHQDVPLVPRLLIRFLLHDLYADKAAGEDYLQKSGLDWTLVYPATLTNGPRTGRYRVGERLALSGLPRISRADVGHFLVGQIDDRTYVRKGVLLAT